MKKTFTPKLLVLVAAMLGLSVTALGQDPYVEDVKQKTVTAAPIEDRIDLIRELALSPDQIKAVVRINRERKPVEAAARTRFREAQRALNEAIYGDAVDEGDVRSKLIEFQAAQGDLARIKFMNELAVRKLLTPSQLVRFREMRRRFAEARKEADKGMATPAPRPIQRLRRRNLPIN